MAAHKRPLTPEAFGKFLRWLSQDDEVAIREYQSIRKKLVRFFMHKGCADPDELFDETIDIVVGKIDACADCPSPLNYCYGVAKNVWRTDMRRPKDVTLDMEVRSVEHHEAEIQEYELKCLDRCMTKLTPGDRDVLTRYHTDQGRNKIRARKLLADGLGGVNALRIRMCRIRKDLRVCIVDCIRQSAN